MSWEQLAAGVDLPLDRTVPLPALVEVDLDVPTPPAVGDIARAAHDATVTTFGDAAIDGLTVAVGAGSRGLTGRVELIRGTVAGLRQLGAEPFVVPAMGSHGGATAEGQREMLASLGVTEDAVGAEIRATMDTVVIAHTASGTPVHLDANAAAADRFLPVNRIKPHTCFKGPVESGCMKMAVVGFGKREGAALVHTCGPVEMRDRLLDACAALRVTGRLLGGIGTVEAADGDVILVEGLTAADVGGERERELTESARALVPPLPFDAIDVLIIDKGGKDISGTTLDPNVTGRFWVPGLDDLARPAVAAIVLLSLTPISGGNALGMGFADFVPASLANQLDFRKTYINCFTAGPAGMRRARLPMVLPDDESCIRAALAMSGRGAAPPRVVRIESTLHLTRMWVSDALLSELPPGASVAATNRA